jgi:hypothetical protein
MEEARHRILKKGACMTVDEILEIVTSSTYPDMSISLNQLNGVFINRLAAVSHQLEVDDLSNFISIAVVLYQKGFKEHLCQNETKDLLDRLASRIEGRNTK